MPRTLFILLPFLLLTACGSGGGSGGSSGGGEVPAIQTVTRYYTSGRVQETGTIVTASNRRTGTWTAYHDVDGSPLRFTGDYADDHLDATKPWREWNVDGSVRVDSSDR